MAGTPANSAQDEATGALGKPIIPKFASFKPRPRVTEERESSSRKGDTSTQDRRGKDDRDKQHSRKHGHSHHSHPSKDSSRERYVSDKSAKPKAPVTPLRYEDLDLDSERYFIEDRLGDTDNDRYGKLHRYSVARYRPSGRGNIVGLDRQYHIINDKSEGSRLVSSSRTNDASRARTQSLLAAAVPERSSERVLALRIGENITTDTTKSYIQFDRHGSRKRRKLNSPLFVLGISSKDDAGAWEQHDDSSKEGLGNEQSEQDSSGDEEIENDGLYEDPERDSRLQLHQLSQAVKAQPTSLDAWQALIKYHDVSESAISRAESQAKADMRLSLYQEAASKVQDSNHREDLLLGMLKEGSRVLDTHKLSNQWQRVMQHNSGSIKLWLSCLDFCQSTVLGYSYDQCKGVFQNALIAVNKAVGMDAEKGKSLVYVFLRTTRFIHDAGFTEYAWALWQAVLELIFLSPREPPVNSQRANYAHFWESESPRIGESLAKGWKTWAASDEDIEPDSKADDLGPPIDGYRLFESWAQTEGHRMATCQFPARTLDDLAEDDPYRLILFSDLTEIIFKLEHITKPILFIEAFLVFCELPTLSVKQDDFDWSNDPFLQQKSAGIPETTLNNDLGHFSGIVDASTLFAREEWMSMWLNKNHADPTTRSWIQRTLQLLVEVEPDESLAEYVISYSFMIDAQDGQKYAKSLLKKRSSSLQLYNAYALIEVRMGNIGAAERVWSTALSMSKTFVETEQKMAVLLLWKTWIWECLDQGQVKKALTLLLSIPEGQVDLEELNKSAVEQHHDTGLQALMTRRLLESYLSLAKFHQEYELLALYTECLSLLQYLTNHQNLEAALEPYDLSSPITQNFQTFQLDPHPSTPTTLLTNPYLPQPIARLISHHTTTTPHSPSFSLSITTLKTLLHHHPSNTILLTLHSRLTHKINMIDRLRSSSSLLLTSSSSVSTPPPLTQCLHAIKQEITRPTYSGGTSHSIRSVFETAITSYPHSPLLWTQYLKWEISLIPPPSSSSSSSAPSKKSEDATTTKKALEVYHRGLNALPWHKGFAMQVFTQPLLREAMGFEKLVGVYEGMEKRGMRIRVGIEEEIEDRRGML